MPLPCLLYFIPNSTISSIAVPYYSKPKQSALQLSHSHSPITFFFSDGI